MWPLVPEKNKMKLNQKGFTIVAALGLAAVLAVGAMFLGQILAYVKSKRMQAQARISSLGYEDSMAVVVAQGVVAKACDDNAPIPALPIPGTSANLRFCNINPASNTTLTFAAYLNDANTPCPSPSTEAQVPAETPGSSERFIDGAALIEFRVELITKAMTQDQKVFGGPTTCNDWKGGAAERQVKTSYQIRRNFRGKLLSQSGSKIMNLAELGI